jgi:hypothetical protein
VAARFFLAKVADDGSNIADYCAGFAFAGIVACVALQRGLGILPQRRIGTDFVDPDRPGGG